MTKSEPSGQRGPWDALVVNDRAGAARFSVHLRPRASRSGILGVREGSLDVAVTALPSDGAANAELIKLLARALDVRRGDVAIVAGASSRAKLIEVKSMTPGVARARFSGAPR